MIYRPRIPLHTKFHENHWRYCRDSCIYIQEEARSKVLETYIFACLYFKDEFVEKVHWAN